MKRRVMHKRNFGIVRGLVGRRILITGAASGIGLATARLMAAQGAQLALLDISAGPLKRLACELDAYAAVADLQSERGIRRAVAASAAAMRGIDGVVNVAGIGGAGFLGDTTLSAWNRVLSVNLTAPFLVCREALPHLKAAGAATIVSVASGQGLLPSSPGMSAYVASKGGLVMFSKALAIELAPHIRVNVVCPGVVDTPLLPASMREAAKSAQSPYALKRIAEASEIADAIAYLSSSASSFVTGVALAVDGGRTFH